MSEYIEDRITSLENRVGDIERHYNLLHTRVNDLEDRIEDHNDDITLLKEDLGKMGKEIDRLRCEVRGTEYLDPLTDKPVDQSTEEFVRVVRCRDCEHCVNDTDETGYCSWFGLWFSLDDYCSKGEKK